jgi:prephenate dehydrogenase
MRIVVLGAGRMGSWLAETLGKDHEVMVRDTDPERAADMSGIRIAKSDPEIEMFGPELLLNCVPLGFTVDVFKGILSRLPAGCMLSDIASVKTGLGEFYASSGHPFVSTHPMFGPTGANVRNLSGENAVIIQESCEAGKEFFRTLYKDLGLNIFEETFDGHDQTVAYSLATPFASTMVFAACMKRLDAPGTTFKKHQEIARALLSEDDRLLAETLFNPYTIRQIELINSQLAYLNHIIRGRDYEEMQKYLAKLRANLGLVEGA